MGDLGGSENSLHPHFEKTAAVLDSATSTPTYVNIEDRAGKVFQLAGGKAANFLYVLDGVILG